MRALGEPELHPEGQFFPDTYRFPRGTTDRSCSRSRIARMQDELEGVGRSARRTCRWRAPMKR